jgi:hypothetical protein
MLRLLQLGLELRFFRLPDKKVLLITVAIYSLFIRTDICVTSVIILYFFVTNAPAMEYRMWKTMIVKLGT